MKARENYKGRWTPEPRRSYRPPEYECVIDKKRYSTKTADLIAGDTRTGIFLYKTKKGNWFELHSPNGRGSFPWIMPLEDEDKAYSTFERCDIKYQPHAFPDVIIEEA